VKSLGHFSIVREVMPTLAGLLNSEGADPQDPVDLRIGHTHAESIREDERCFCDHSSSPARGETRGQIGDVRGCLAVTASDLGLSRAAGI
jgi:hypothetical protein